MGHILDDVRLIYTAEVSRVPLTEGVFLCGSISAEMYAC